MGYLGGANFPNDPTDLGPLVPLPGGWQELFQYFAAVGINQVEFAGYGQNANNPGGTAAYPGDGNAAGRAAYLAYAQHAARLPRRQRPRGDRQPRLHPEHLVRPEQPRRHHDRRRPATGCQTELEFASILGMPYMGTGSDPTSANNRNIEPWTVAGEKWRR